MKIQQTSQDKKYYLYMYNYVNRDSTQVNSSSTKKQIRLSNLKSESDISTILSSPQTISDDETNKNLNTNSLRNMSVNQFHTMVCSSIFYFRSPLCF